MQRKPSLIRDILISVEDTVTYSVTWHYRRNTLIPDPLTMYSHDEILYHVSQCEDAELICGVKYADAGDWIDISDLTPVGHDFLANIRNDTVWNAIKEKAANASLTILTALAQSEALKYFGLS